MTEPLIPAILQTPKAWARRLAYATGTGVFLGVVGAFGSYSHVDLPSRVASWVIMVWVGTAIFPVLATAAAIKGKAWGLSLWISVPLAIAVGSLPMAVAATAVSHVFIDSHEPWNLWRTWVQVVIVALPVVGGYIAIRGRLGESIGGASPAPEPIAAPAAPEPALLARLPTRLGRDLLCLEMEDHYVRAHTALGSDLMLMRMRDAVDLAEGLGGLQVHRSWWVAAHAVERHSTADRKLVLTLRNGLDVPVARSAVAAVKAAGWLE